MKKIYLFLTLICFAFLLVSCGSKVTYLDPETNEERTLEIKKTEDKKAVIDSLEAIAYSETKVESSNSFTLKLSLNYEETSSHNGVTLKNNLETNAKMEIEVAKNPNINTYSDLLKATKVYAEFEIYGKGPDSNNPTKQVKYRESIIKIYIESGIFYADIKIDNQILNLFGLGASFQLINGKIIKINILDLIDLNQKLDEEDKKAIDEFIKGESNTSFKDLLPDELFDDLRNNLKKIVEDNNIIISRVKGSKVTYSSNSNLIEGFKSTIDFIIDVSNNSIVGLNFNTSDNNSNIKASATIKYSSKVTSIPRTDKDSSVDMTAAVSEFMK